MGCIPIDALTKVDANSGYWQVPLDKASQELTTFITPIGRFCCTRGPYGLSSMQEIFSKKFLRLSKATADCSRQSRVTFVRK